MADKNNGIGFVLDSLVKGLDSFMTSKTVVGDPIVLGDTIILPLVDVSFGVGAGAGASEKGDKGCGGIGGKMSPSAVLVIQNGTIKLVNVKNQDAITKLLDMVPDLVNKFTVPKEEKSGEVSLDDAVAAAFSDDAQ